MRAVDLLDKALPGPALVVGSLPPEGRDLDLLVREPERRAAEATLLAAGFEDHDGTWVRFAACTAEVVELIPARLWGLPEAELRALFTEAMSLDGRERVLRPAPHHALLILARNAAGVGGPDPRRRGRVEAAVAEDPEAWPRAVARAPAWRIEAALAALQAGGAPRHRRIRERLPPAMRARLAGARALKAARRPGTVIAFSGLDGAGKSSQARALAETLGRLGYDAEVAWTRIASNEGFWGVAFAVKRRVASLQRAPARAADPAQEPRQHSGLPAPSSDPLRTLRRRSGLLTELWAAVVALDNIRAQRQVTGAALARDRVVICDRYTLDSIVELRAAYANGRRFPVQRLLLQRLTRTPLRAFLLEIPPEVARERDEEHELDWLRRHHALYREERAALGVVRLEGRRAMEDLSADIAREVWSALRAART